MEYLHGDVENQLKICIRCIRIHNDDHHDDDDDDDTNNDGGKIDMVSIRCGQIESVMKSSKSSGS